MENEIFGRISPERSELSEESIENLCIALANARDKNGIPLSIKPTRFIFTDEALRKFFGWTDEDFNVALSVGKKS